MKPYFNSIQDFISMTGHGQYVWTAWGIVLFCMLVFFVNTIKARKKMIAKLRQYQYRNQC